jgi:hypothetical protein
MFLIENSKDWAGAALARRVIATVAGTSRRKTEFIDV